MNQSKHILFISWDGANTAYLPHLFLPIFDKIQQRSAYTFSVVQFSAASPESIASTKAIAKNKLINYQHIALNKNKVANIITLIHSIHKIKKLLRQTKVDYVMPRSVMPGFLCFFLTKKIPMIYDADGLATLEKRDFENKPFKLQFYTWVERSIAKRAKFMLTRTPFAKNWLTQKYRVNKNHIGLVANGVDSALFHYDPRLRYKIRSQFKIAPTAVLMIYVGSIGTKYAWKEAIQFFEAYNKENSDAHLLFLSGENAIISQEVASHLNKQIHVRMVPHQEVNHYLNAADVGICFIQPKESVKAVNPIKINEYLMAGLPVMVNKMISDSFPWLQEKENAIIVKNSFMWDNSNLKQDLQQMNRRLISENAQKYCSLDSTANDYICHLNKV